MSASDRQGHPKQGAPRALAVVAALLMATGVGLGSFGAHALDGVVSESRLATFETGVRYQLVHGLGILATVALGRGIRAGWLLAFGATVFSGSLYVLVLTDTAWLGAIAPAGGAAMIAGWCGLAWSLTRAARA